MTAAADAWSWRLLPFSTPFSNGSLLVNATCLEAEALRAMLGLPTEEPEPDERAPLEPPPPAPQDDSPASS